MNPQRTTTRRIRKRPFPLPLAIFAGAFVILLAVCGFIGTQPTHHPTGTVAAADGDPFVVTPEPAHIAQLHLTPDMPALNDVQIKYMREAEAIWLCPLCFGVDKDPIPMDANEAALFVALIYTESSLNPYDEYGNHKVSSAGCVGLSQLCGALLTAETRDSDELNLYAGAAEFHRLVTTSADLNEAVSSYKGQTTSDTEWQADTVWSYVRVRGGR